MSKAAPGSFQEAFEQRLVGIKERAAKVGMTVTDVCTSAGVARATPERWKTQIPLTVKLIDRMEAAVAAQEIERAAQA